MKLLEKICKVLEVELGEEWHGNDKNYYKIEEDDILIKFENGEVWYSAGPYVYKHILLGLIKPVWKPKQDENYFIPRPDFKSMCREQYWEEDSIDYHRLNNNLVFKTKEDAIECANKMLKSIKE